MNYCQGFIERVDIPSLIISVESSHVFCTVPAEAAMLSVHPRKCHPKSLMKWVSSNVLTWSQLVVATPFMGGI